MKNIPLSIIMLLSVFLLTISCQTDPTNDEISGETDEEDRNMGGLGLPRGLLVTSEDVAPGFVLTIYNNDIPGGPDSMNYSAIYEITPPVDAQGNYIIPTEQL